MSDNTKNMLFGLIVLSHILFLCYWCYYFILEMRKTIRLKIPTLYQIVFLCCNKRKFKTEKEVEEF